MKEQHATVTGKMPFAKHKAAMQKAIQAIPKMGAVASTDLLKKGPVLPPAKLQSVNGLLSQFDHSRNMLTALSRNGERALRLQTG
jgi:hypothetical protein